MEPFASLAGLGRDLDLGGKLGPTFFFDSSLGTWPKAGEGRYPLILVHGLGDEGDSFRAILPLLAPGQRVIAPDLPGFGRSRALGKVNLRACVDALLALIEAETPGGAVLAGSSLGAVVAELASFRRPDLVHGLVLMDGGIPTPPAGGEAASGLIPGLGEKGYRAFRGRPEAAYESLRPYYADLDAMPEEDRRFLARRVVERVESDSQLRAYFSLFRSLALTVITAQTSLARQLASASCPLLVIWGAEDKVIPKEGAALLARSAPLAKVLVIGGSGHLPHQERPEQTAAAIATFIESLPRHLDAR